jgi:hypothetical protein
MPNHIKISDLENLKPDENDETLELSEKLACDWIYLFNTEMKQVD